MQTTRPSKPRKNYYRNCIRNSTVPRFPETGLPTKPDQCLGLELRKRTRFNKPVISLLSRLSYPSYKKNVLSTNESVTVNKKRNEPYAGVAFSDSNRLPTQNDTFQRVTKNVPVDETSSMNF